MKTIKVNQPPPLAQRPRCPQCDKPLRPSWRRLGESYKGEPAQWWVKQEWRGEYRGYGHFCTLRCCERFANAVIDKTRRT